MEDIVITDNGGATFDRYLVYTNPNQRGTVYHECYTMSPDPLWPRGVNMWAGELPAPDGSEPQVPLEELPCNVKTAIQRRLTHRG